MLSTLRDELRRLRLWKADGCYIALSFELVSAGFRSVLMKIAWIWVNIKGFFSPCAMSRKDCGFEMQIDVIKRFHLRLFLPDSEVF